MLSILTLCFVLTQQPVAEEIVVYDPDTFFELSEEMKQFMDEHVMTRVGDAQRLTFLLNAIFREDGLNMTYSNHRTTTPSETFLLRTGNCLSFTAMFIAMARYSGVKAGFQEVFDLSSWTKRGEFTVFNRHINCAVWVEGKRKEVDFNYLNKRDFRLVTSVSDARGIAHFYNNLGVEELGAGDNAMAKYYFKKSIETDQEFSFGWANLGILHRIEGDFDLAEASYLRASKINPDDHTPELNLAHLYNLQGKQHQAERILKRVRRFLERNPFHHYQLGKEEFANGNYKESAKHFRRALRIHDTQPQFLTALAGAYQQMGKIKKATRLVEKAKENAAMGEEALYDKKLQLLAASSR